MQIELLANCKQHIPQLAELWLEEIGKPWIPGAALETAIQTYKAHCNQEVLPLTYVAHEQGRAIGMVSLRENDGIRDDLRPWLGSLIVAASHRQQGIGKQLIEMTKQAALQRHFRKLFLLTLDPTIHFWYERLGWKKIAKDQLYHHPVIVMETNL